MRFLVLALCTALAFVACFGCDGPAPTPALDSGDVDGGAPMDAGASADAYVGDAGHDATLPTGVTPSPDGLGYCCRTSGLGKTCLSGVGFSPGGFADVPGHCRYWTDVVPCAMSRMFVDEHGCPAWDEGTVFACCIVRDDAGPDDAGQDASPPLDAAG